LAEPHGLGERLRDPRVLWVEDVLRYADTDANGHINNSTFSVLCESGRVHLFTQELNPTLPPGMFFVIARLAIDFRAELHYPGQVRTGTWITRIGRSSLGLAQAIVADGRVAGEAECVCVLIDERTRRASPFSHETKVAAERLLLTPSA
jgi:acyl-CoA thioester hydrolase